MYVVLCGMSMMCVWYVCGVCDMYEVYVWCVVCGMYVCMYVYVCVCVLLLSKVRQTPFELDFSVPLLC